ncbi:MAG: methyl-accepting chemotaxis protein [Calditrichaeota bacterium]|nr:MAG: methyl-accepting chemotaxis protein [Calditrichota bacterium]
MNKSSQKFITRYLKYMLPVTLVIVALWGYWKRDHSREVMLNQKAQGIRMAIKTVTALLDVNALEKIQTKEDFRTPYYQRVNKQLQAAKKSMGLDEHSLENLQIRIVRLKGNVSTLVAVDGKENVIGKEFDNWTEMSRAVNTDSVFIRFEENDGKTLLYAVGRMAGMGDKGLLVVTARVTSVGETVLESFAVPAIIIVLLLLISLFVLIVEMNHFNNDLQDVEKNIDLLKEGKSVFTAHKEDSYCAELYPKLKELESNWTENKTLEEEQEKIQKQIKELLKIVSSAADGDFTQQAEVTADALGALSDSFNIMISDLSHLIRDVKKAAEQVATSTEEILRNTEQMTHGAESQASQTDHISKLAREMADLINNTNSNAQRASEAAKKAIEVARRGEEIVRKSNDGMQRIRKSVQEVSRQMNTLSDNSVRISEITDFISEIASRTNLLALNASIEAARAGDAGRGFSVVADEIRNLAERSAKAAEEISDLIDDIQTGTSQTLKAIENGEKEVTEGTRLVDGAAEALKEILDSVEISTSSTVDISKATEEQAQSSQNIVQSLEHIAGIAKETADGAKKSKESALSLEKLSKQLNQAVQKFRLSE